MNISKILVAIDESENSQRALDFALGLSGKFGSSVTILNVSEAMPIGQGSETVASSNTSAVAIATDVNRIHEEFLVKAVDRAKANNPDIAISSMHRQGDPTVEIVHIAKEGAFDIIVVGHRGQGKMRVRDFLMGTISEKVAHLAHCPVVIVK